MSALLWLTACAAAPAISPAFARFAAGTVTVDGRDHPYRLLVPTDATTPLPLVVFLHGAGERGDDNERQLTWLPRRMDEPAQRRAHPCWLLAVQCPEDQRWVDVSWGESASSPMPAQPSQPMRAVMAAMEQVLAERPVDPARVYLTGLSMGGYGAFDLGCRWPDRFAALLPVCGGGDERAAPRLASLPTWIWHGDQDRAVPVQRSRAMAAAIRAAGGDVRYTELAGVGHDSWRQAYGDDGALDWLFAQRRQGN
ncbi:MAG: PHB depolymerase family esterase [Planctomycetota bacterium]